MMSTGNSNLGSRIGRRAGNLEEGTMIYIRIIDDDDLTAAKAWSTFTAFLNADELIDEVALAARESSHGKAAYTILRRGERRHDPDPGGTSSLDRRPQREGLTMQLTVDRHGLDAALTRLRNMCSLHHHPDAVDRAAAGKRQRGRDHGDQP